MNLDFRVHLDRKPRTKIVPNNTDNNNNNRYRESAIENKKTTAVVLARAESLSATVKQRSDNGRLKSRDKSTSFRREINEWNGEKKT